MKKYGVDFCFTHDIKPGWNMYHKQKAQEHIARYGVIIVNCTEYYLQKNSSDDRGREITSIS